MPTHYIHGHAIVSADDRYATAAGAFPPGLRIDADQRRYKAALEAAAVVVLGRAGHLSNPNDLHSNRLVLTHGARGIEKHADAWWWNPADLGVTEALTRAAPGGGTAAIVGGMRVLDLFLAYGFHAFDLARVEDIRLPTGRPLFSSVAGGQRAEAVLVGAGLAATQSTVLQESPRVTLSLWQRPPFIAA